MHIDHFYPFDL